MQKLLISILVLGLSYTTFAQEKAKPEAAASWSGQMQNLGDVLAQMIPFLSNPTKFSDPKNSQVINDYVKKLSSLSHTLGKGVVNPDADPSLQFVSNQFEDEIKRAQEALNNGHRDYARHLLKNSTSYCIQCHTRNSTGPHFADGKLAEAIAQMPNLDRGEFFAATRQFDKALGEFKQVLKTSKNVIEWDRSARYAMAIAVRFLNSPEQALEVAQLILSSEQAPLFLKEDAIVWKKSISDWQKEVQTKKQIQGLKQAEKLIATARKVQKFETDHSADIYFLRASASLHDALGGGLKGEEKSKALLLTGRCYDALRDLNLWSLHEQYYEACIRNTPHTKISKECYTKYEQSVFMGFSGSQGLMLPIDIQAKLTELKALTIAK